MVDQPHVLLIDDELRSARQIQHELENAGLRLTLAEDGPKVLRTLSQSHVDLILIDYAMPVRRVCGMLATQGRPRVPVIIMADESSDLEVERLKQDCALAAVIYKPFSLAKLATVIRERCLMGFSPAQS